MQQTGSFRLTSEMAQLLAEIDSFKSRWQALCTDAPHKLLALNFLAQLETPIEKPQFLIAFAQRPAPPLTESQIFALHRGLMTNSDKEKDKAHAGQYKTFHNSLRRFSAEGEELGIVMWAARPEETPQRMQGLLEWFNSQRQSADLHPLLVIGMFHLLFLNIHPFNDGNGRTCRLLTNLLMVQAGYGYTPFSSLENLIRESPDAWYPPLRETEETLSSPAPDWEPWLLAFLKTLQRQVSPLRDALDAHRETLDALSPEEARALQHVAAHSSITARTLSTLAGIDARTARATLLHLSEKRLLAKRGWGPAVRYVRRI